MNTRKFCAAAVAGLVLFAAAGTPEWPNLEEVIIVTKCHLDVGYTHTVPELVKLYRTSYMDKALALFDSDRTTPPDLRARWTLPAWLTDAILNGQYSPERRAKIEDAVRQRRLMWHALPFTSETEASDAEELVRMFSYGSNLSRKFGFDLPRYAKQTDVPDHAWVMPTLLAHAGVKFLHLGSNPCSKPKSVVEKIPTLCWWEGPDGSRILLGYSPKYGWMGGGSVTPPKGWRHKTWLAYYMRGDNAGPMSRKEVDNILRKARQQLPGIKVRFGNPDEFADAIIAEEKAHPSLPVVRGDMPDTWIHGMMTLPEATAIHRRTTGDLVTLGQLDTTLRAFGVATEPVAELLELAYRDSGLYSEHTWGLAGFRVRGPKLYRPGWRQRYDSGEYKEFDESFQYHADYARRACKAAHDGIQARMEALARSVAVEGPRVVVFNPLPYERDAVVEVEMPDGYSLPDGIRDGCKVRFLAKGLPAGGYKTFTVDRASVKQQEDMLLPPAAPLHTRHFTVKFDLEKGGIASFVENATGRELVKQGGHVLGQFLHERFSRNEVDRYSKIYNEREKNDGLSKPGMPDVAHSPYAAITPSGWRARMKRSPLGVEVVMTPDDTKGLAKAYEMRFSFPDHLPCVDITWRVEDKTPDPIPEGGWLCLPFNVEGPSFRVGRIGGTIDPTKDIIFGANKDILCVDRAITVRSGPGGEGVGVASADLPLWSLGRPGLWRYEPDYVPTEPEVFANLYNNQWNTNFPLWIPGSWSASLRVYPVAKGADEEQTVFAPAWEIRQPAVAAFAAGDDLATKNTKVTKKGRAGAPCTPIASGVALSRKGVRLTAFCPNPDGEGIVLRVWEQAGKGGEITVSLPEGMNATEAQPVNLRGEYEGKPIPVKNGRFSFELHAWAPKSFILSGVVLPNVKEYIFPLSAIKLTGGPLKWQQEQNREYLLRLDPDRLLSRFRLEAGLKPKAEPYNGWESPKFWLDLAGHILGFYMAGAAMTVEATGDEELKRRLLYIVDELDAVQNAHGDGYALAARDGRKVFDEIASGKIDVKINPKTEYGAFINNRFEPIYTLNKVLIGLWRIHVATGSDKARRVFLRLSDWFGNAVVEKLYDAQLQKVLDCEHASLPETFAVAFTMTGDEKYKRWARRLCHERMLAPLADGNAAHLCFHHGNNEIPKYTGFERVYRITGEERLHRAMVNANRAFIYDHAWANGGNSHREHLFPKADFEKKLFMDGGPESCNSVNMLRQTEALFETEPSPDKMDFYERVLFNHLLSTHDPIRGRTIYYTPPKPGASRTYSDEFDSMWCCTGTGFEAPGKYGQMVFTHAPDESAVTVQLFAPATLDWKARGVKLRQETAFPYGETSCVKVESVGKDPKFTVKVRCPVWVGRGFMVYVNGETASVQQQHYISITREWKVGDRIDIEFPMSLRAEYLPGSKKYVAFFYGPTLLVGDLGSDGLKQSDYFAHPPASNTSSWKFGKPIAMPQVPASAATDPTCCLERTTGGPIVFHLKGSDILLKPMYDLHFSRYTMYWRLVDPAEEKAFADAVAKEKNLAKRAVDSVKIGDAASEKAHGFAGEKTESGTGLYGEHHEYHWRHATSGGFFAYRLSVGDRPGGRTLVAKYCARERGPRTFDILVDRVKVYTEKLVDNHKPAFVFTEMPIPAELLSGKEQVEVRFVPKPGNTAGGVFGLTMLAAE